MNYDKMYFQNKYPFVQFIESDICDKKSIQLKDEDAFLSFVQAANIKTVFINCVYEEKEPIIIDKNSIKDYFAEMRDYEPCDKRKCEYVDFDDDVDLFEEYNWEHDKQFEKLIIMKSQEWNRGALKKGPFQSIDTGIYIRYNNQWVSLQCSSSVGTEYDFTTVDGAILYLIETELPQYIKDKQNSMSSGGIK
jgi:hypothetical protein